MNIDVSQIYTRSEGFCDACSAYWTVLDWLEQVFGIMSNGNFHCGRVYFFVWMLVLRPGKPFLPPALLSRGSASEWFASKGMCRCTSPILRPLCLLALNTRQTGFLRASRRMTRHPVSFLFHIMDCHLTVFPAFVEWAKAQISIYADMFRKQVFSSDVDEETVRECIAKTHAQNRKVCR